MTTRTNFVLVDFENVQPKDIGLLKDGPFKVKVFLGPNQSTIPVALATALDPLLKYLKGKKILAQRSICITDIPFFKPSLPVAPEAQVEAVIADLVRRKASKPRTQKTLLSTLHALFKKELSEQQLAALFAALCKRGVVKVEGAKVSYALPTEP